MSKFYFEALYYEFIKQIKTDEPFENNYTIYLIIDSFHAELLYLNLCYCCAFAFFVIILCFNLK